VGGLVDQELENGVPGGPGLTMSPRSGHVANFGREPHRLEIANGHLGTLAPCVLLADIEKRPTGWLIHVARQMQRSLLTDFADCSAR